MVGPVVVAKLKQPCVFDYSLGWELFEMYSANLKPLARNPGRIASFASLFFVILHHERVTWSILEEL